jgi:hypothetical protein
MSSCAYFAFSPVPCRYAADMIAAACKAAVFFDGTTFTHGPLGRQAHKVHEACKVPLFFSFRAKRLYHLELDGCV